MASSALQFFHQFCFIGTNGWTPVMWALPWKPSPPKWFLIRRCQHRSFLASFTSVIKTSDFFYHFITTFKNSGMSLMEGRPDIFQELREKFVDTFKVSFLVEKMRFLSSVSKMHEKEITDFFKRKKFVKLVRLHGMNNALRYFPFDHEFGIRHSSVSV